MKLFGKITLVVALLLAGAVGYFAWTVSVKDLPAGTYESTATIEVLPTLFGFAVNPVADSGKPGLIFMAGAFVAADAYLPFARSVAEAGYPVRLIGLELGNSMMPGQQPRLFGTISSFMDGNRPWAVGGHSLGSAQATIFAAAHPDEIAGLFITGSGYAYNDVSMLTVPVTLMRATNDNVANKNDDRDRAGNMPANAVITTIEGGNHAQFGFYGPQIMDGTATISRADQQAQMTAAALALLQRASGGAALADRAPFNDFRVIPAQYATLNSVTVSGGHLVLEAMRQES